MRILFVSRAYPPVIGGIENQNYELSKWLPKIEGVEMRTIANTRGKLFLPLFLPYAMMRVFFLISRYDVLLLGDGVLTAIGWKMKLFFRKPAISIVHGLDLTFKNWLYQKFWVGIFLKKMDRLIAVGNETVRVAKEKGIPADKIVFIPNGIDTEKFEGNFPREGLKDILGMEIENKRFVLTSGRLAKRKGAAWFIRKVLPALPQNVIYVLAGDGPDKENVLNAIKRDNLGTRVRVLGKVTDETRNALMHACDIFVQPNIEVEGDMEGFGISVIEAAYCGIPVLASRLEGLQDAIKDGQNGFLLESGNAQEWKNKIMDILENEPLRAEMGEKARRFVAENYGWEKIARLYLQEIEKATSE